MSQLRDNYLCSGNEETVELQKLHKPDIVMLIKIDDQYGLAKLLKRKQLTDKVSTGEQIYKTTRGPRDAVYFRGCQRSEKIESECVF